MSFVVYSRPTEKYRESGNGVESLQTNSQHSAGFWHRCFTQHRCMCVYLQMFSIQVGLKQREHVLNVSKLLIEHYDNTFNHLIIKPLFLVAISSFPPWVWQGMYKCWQKLALHTPLCKIPGRSFSSPVSYALESASSDTCSIVYILYGAFYGEG